MLAALVAEEFGLPLAIPCHREEAAHGAAVMAALGTSLLSDLPSARHLIRYTEHRVGE